MTILEILMFHQPPENPEIEVVAMNALQSLKKRSSVWGDVSTYHEKRICLANTDIALVWPPPSYCGT